MQAVTSKLASKADVIQLYRYPGLSSSAAQTLLRKAKAKVTDAITSIDGEACYNIGLSAQLSPKEAETLAWLLRETFEPELLTSESRVKQDSTTTVVEVGPRSNFSTAFSTNAVSVCGSTGLQKVTRMERSRRYVLKSSRPLTDAEKVSFAALVHDRMTEELYSKSLASFKVDTKPAPVFSVPVMAEGRAALEKINKVRSRLIVMLVCMSAAERSMMIKFDAFLTGGKTTHMWIYTWRPELRYLAALPPLCTLLGSLPCH
jgi:phosphoribosylformylglycinamidine synthase